MISSVYKPDMPEYNMINLFWFWGKTNHEKKWHPALCHMIDVGVVARELVEGLPKKLRTKLAHSLGLPQEKISDVLAFLGALHDIGKISPGFQEKVDWLSSDLAKHGFSFPQSMENYHGQVCMDRFPDILIDELLCPGEFACGISCILAAHHGVFPKEEGLSAGDGLWHKARVETVKKLASFFCVESLQNIQLPLNPVFLMLAGLVSVSDWLGSQEDYFSFHNGSIENLEHYKSERKKIAKMVVNDLKMNAPEFENRSFKELFGFDKPNGCQHTALKVVAQLAHPMLVVVESSMGNGKTEAALASYVQIAECGGTCSPRVWG